MRLSRWSTPSRCVLDALTSTLNPNIRRHSRWAAGAALDWICFGNRLSTVGGSEARLRFPVGTTPRSPRRTRPARVDPYRWTGAAPASVQHRWQIRAGGFGVQAGGHQGHRMEHTHPLTQAPAEQVRVSRRYDDAWTAHVLGGANQRFHVH